MVPVAVVLVVPAAVVLVAVVLDRVGADFQVDLGAVDSLAVLVAVADKVISEVVVRAAVQDLVARKVAVARVDLETTSVVVARDSVGRDLVARKAAQAVAISAVKVVAPVSILVHRGVVLADAVLASVVRMVLVEVKVASAVRGEALADGASAALVVVHTALPT